MKCNTCISARVSRITRYLVASSQMDMGRSAGSKSSLTRHTSIRSSLIVGSRELLLSERERPQVEMSAPSRRRLHRPVAALAYWPRMHVFGKLPIPKLLVSSSWASAAAGLVLFINAMHLNAIARRSGLQGQLAVPLRRGLVGAAHGPERGARASRVPHRLGRREPVSAGECSALHAPHRRPLPHHSHTVLRSLLTALPDPMLCYCLYVGSTNSSHLRVHLKYSIVYTV